MKCPNCNAEIPNGSKFCPECGTKIEYVIQKKKEEFDYLVAKCPTGHINGCTDFYNSFGYEYESNQMVYTQYQHFDGAISVAYNNFAATQVFTHVETNEFLAVTFKRSRSIENYNKLVELENKYNSLNLEKEHYKTGAFVFMFPLGGAILLLSFVFFAYITYDSVFLALAFPFLFIGLALIALGVVFTSLKKKQQRNADERHKQVLKQANDILNEAKKYSRN